MLGVAMLSVTFFYCQLAHNHAQCHCAECCYAKCHYGEFCYAEFSKA
jgi:hypothetical protein